MRTKSGARFTSVVCSTYKLEAAINHQSSLNTCAVLSFRFGNEL